MELSDILTIINIFVTIFGVIVIPSILGLAAFWFNDQLKRLEHDNNKDLEGIKNELSKQSNKETKIFDKYFEKKFEVLLELNELSIKTSFEIAQGNTNKSLSIKEKNRILEERMIKIFEVIIKNKIFFTKSEYSKLMRIVGKLRLNYEDWKEKNSFQVNLHKNLVLIEEELQEILRKILTY